MPREKDNGTAPPSEGSTTSNLWSFATEFGRALLAVGALVWLTIFLVRHYTDVKDVTTVLGVVVPVLAAALGATIGYAGGEAKGKANKDEAVKRGRRDLARQLQPALEAAEKNVTSGMVEPIRRGMSSPPGAETYTLDITSSVAQDLRLDAVAMDEAQRSLAEARGIVDAVERG